MANYTVNSSKKTSTGSVAASQLQHPVSYIGPTDPRALNPEYLRANPWIKVLNATDWAAWLNTNYSSSSSNTISAASVIDNVLISDPINGQVDLSLGSPGKPTWDGSYKTVNTDTGVLLDIQLVFPPSPDDEFDGSVVYRAEFDLVASNVATPSTGTTAPNTNMAVNDTLSNTNSKGLQNNPGALSNAISTQVTSSSILIASWPKMANAISYNVTITGANIPANTGSGKVLYGKVPAYAGYTKTYTSGLSYGKYTTSFSGSKFVFTLTQQSGKIFSGTYKVAVTVNYAETSSVEVTGATITV
jgi:hypothetical protein